MSDNQTVVLSTQFSDIVLVKNKTYALCGQQFYFQNKSETKTLIDTSYDLDVFNRVLENTHLHGSLIQDKVCLSSSICVNYEFFSGRSELVHTCRDHLGIGPSQDAKQPNLITALAKNGIVPGNEITLDLNWSGEGQYIYVGT